MIILFIICTLIVGLMILFGSAVAISWKAQSSEGIEVFAMIGILFFVSYMVITGMVHIARIYWKLPNLPWEFAGYG